MCPLRADVVQLRILEIGDRPQQDLVVVARGGKPLTIGGKSRCIDRCVMSNQLFELGHRLCIPRDSRVIKARAHEKIQLS